MPERQDFIQRLLEELRQTLAQVVRFREAGSHDAALATLLQAQERLFVRPAQEFMMLPLERQLRLLVIGESDAAAREKCTVFATLLTEMARTYQARDQVAPAQGARRLALQVLLLTAQRRAQPGADAELGPRIAALRQELPDDALDPELTALLERYDASVPPAASG